MAYTEWTNLNLYNGTWGIHQIYEIYYGFSDCVAYFLYLVLGVYLIRELRYVSQEIRNSHFSFSIMSYRFSGSFSIK